LGQPPLAPECKGCLETFCKGCHETEHKERLEWATRLKKRDVRVGHPARYLRFVRFSPYLNQMRFNVLHSFGRKDDRFAIFVEFKKALLVQVTDYYALEQRGIRILNPFAKVLEQDS